MLRLKKIYRVIFVALLACFTLIMIASAIVSLFYEQAVIRYLKSYLDEHLRTQISVEDIRFRLLKGFPNATFELKQIVVLSGEDFSSSDFVDFNADTLLEAQTMTFQFDLISLANKKYELKQINVSEGTLNFLIDEKNRNNLSIWENREGQASHNQRVDLNSIHMNDMDLNIISLPGKLRLFAGTEKMVLKGSVSQEMTVADVKGDLDVHLLAIKNQSRLTETEFQLQCALEAVSNKILLNGGELLYGKNSCTFSGEVETLPTGSSVHIDFEFPDCRLEEITPLAVKLLDANSPPYDFKGKGMIMFALDGRIGMGGSDWSFRSDFDVKRAEAVSILSGAVIENISFTGTSSGSIPGKVSFQIGQYVSSLSEGQISGEFLSGSPISPDIIIYNKSIINLSKLYELIDIDFIKNMIGILDADFTLTFSPGRTSAFSFGDLIENRLKGHFYAHDVTLVAGENDIVFENLAGRFACDKNLVFDSLSFTLDRNEYLVDGTAKNLAAYFSDQGDLIATLSIACEKLDMSRYLAKGSGSGTVLPASHPGSFSNIDLKAYIKADEFTATRFQADELSVELALRKDTSYLKNFNFNFIDGSISGNALICRLPSKGYSVTCNAITRFIDIHELFKAFNNFTQQFIVDENVQGRLEGTVNFSAEWDPSLRLQPATIRALADIEIHDGELVDFEPMMKLSRYIDAEELMRVRFSTLRNQIMIIDRMVEIPEMEIHSSAFNITASGIHSFDNVFDYRLRVLLSEVLFNRARNRRTEIDEFYVAKQTRDLPGIPLIIAGTPNDYDVRLDRKKAFDLSVQDDRDLENAMPEKPDPSGFIIEWDEPVETGESQQKTDREVPEEEFFFQWNDNDETGE